MTVLEFRNEVLKVSKVDILDSKGEFRNAEEVFVDIAQNWDDIKAKGNCKALSELLAHRSKT